MDHIIPPNLFTISSCDLNTKFNDRCHADWSRTNFISIVTLDGIYILKPNLASINSFEIELIRNPLVKFRHVPFEKNNISLCDIWNTLDNRQYMEAFLDPALTTNITKISNETYQRRYRLAKWSPIIETYPKQCLLAAITVDWQLLIFSHEDGVWAVNHDLSEAYDNFWMQTMLAKNIRDTTFDGIRRNVHSLSFSTICWKESKDGRQYLIAITLTGDIVIWRLSLTAENGAEYQKNVVNFSVRTILRTNHDHVSCMQFCNNLLITTSRNGQVSLYDLSVIFDELDAQIVQQSGRKNIKQIKAIAIIDIAPTAVIWHQDNIEVMDFYLQPLTSDTFRIVLAKGTNICWCTIHYIPKTDCEPATLAISDSFSAIDGLDPEVSLHQTPATWLRPAGDKKAVLIADDGSFFQLEFIDDRQDTSPSFNAIRTGKVDLTDMIPRGLCSSPNGHLITMVSSVTFLVDPLKIPAPTKLILLPTQNERKYFIDCLKSLLDENWLSLNNIRSPMDVCDRLDCILSMFPHLNHNQCFHLHMMLKEEVVQLGTPTTRTQFLKLKIISYILMKLLGLDKARKNDEWQDELVKNLHNMILLDNIENILNLALTNDHNQSGDMRLPLSHEQVNSIRNCMSWLDKSSDGQQLRDKYKDKFDKLIDSEYKSVPYETCSICQCDIPFESYKYGTCTNKHQFIRCSKSLLVLDLSKRDRLQCSDCKRSYMAKLVWPSKDLWLCLYCQ